MSERVTWPLWECIPPGALVSLILYQWDNYGQKLEILIDIYREMESLEEIDRIIRVPSKYPKGFYSHG